jgi:endonuclease/exonuclease/phosphatase (EEP) superfamily protein YafD
MLEGLAGAGYGIEVVHITRHELWHSSTSGRGWRPSPGIWSLAIASRLPILGRHELSMGRVFQDRAGTRVALQVDVELEGQPVHVAGLHTSSKLYFAGPVTHLRHLRSQLPPSWSGRAPEPAILAGDFNLWGPGVVSLLPGWRRTVRGATYPAHRPHSQIDHILVNRAVECIDSEVLPPIGSDHRAVRARLSIGSVT